MSSNSGHLKRCINTTINKGVIDSWLRGLCAFVPEAKPAAPEHTPRNMDVTHLAANTFTLGYSGSAPIEHADIENMDGYKQLVIFSSQNNVRLDFTDTGGGNLIVDFTPEEPFSSSTILGKKFTNVVPALIGVRAR